jgi:hypothetical protein
VTLVSSLPPDAHTVNVASAEGGAERFYLACGYRPRSLLVGVFTAQLPHDYRATEFLISGERVMGERTFFYVDAPDYDPARKVAVRARFRAAGMTSVFVKRVR